MEKFNELVGTIDGLVWGKPLILIILLGGFWLTICLRCVQVRHLPLALKWMVRNEEEGKGEVSSFAALCTALSATIGTGNIVGVATAIDTGGPGALFWMEIAAFLGMATKYTEGFLAVKYREIDENGHALGGPFYYIEKGMGPKWKWLAKFFALFGAIAGAFGIGTITQVNGIATAVEGFFDPNQAHTVNMGVFGTHTWAIIIASLVVAILAGLVLIGGIKRIGNVATIIVPFMIILYAVSVLILLVFNANKIPEAIVLIVKGAFNPQAVGGGLLGSFMIAVQAGVARGIFSNEAGLGSAPIAAAAAQTNEPVRQGLVTMTGTFIDTIIVCTLTGLSVVITGGWMQDGLEGGAITTYAFSNGLPFPNKVGAFILMICLSFFAFTTILGWDYYSERCVEYLTRGSRKAVKAYRWIYILAVFIGPYLTVSAVWNIADIFNGLMAFPNMIALFALSGVAAKETRDFFKSGRAKEMIEADDRAFAELKAEKAAEKAAKKAK